MVQKAIESFKEEEEELEIQLDDDQSKLALLVRAASHCRSMRNHEIVGAKILVVDPLFNNLFISV
jgi:hypothetical protein